MIDRKSGVDARGENVVNLAFSRKNNTQDSFDHDTPIEPTLLSKDCGHIQLKSRSVMNMGDYDSTIVTITSVACDSPTRQYEGEAEHRQQPGDGAAEGADAVEELDRRLQVVVDEEDVVFVSIGQFVVAVMLLIAQ